MKSASATATMEDPLSPREFLRRYHLPQLVRINEAHLHQLNKSRLASAGTVSGANRTRSLESNGTTSSVSSGYNGYSRQRQPLPPTSATTRGRHRVVEIQEPPVLTNNGKKSLGKASGTKKNKKSMLDGQLLDLDQPFLLYKAYSCRQVIADTLAPDSSNDPSSYRRAGLGALLIPESYTGWFALVTNKGHTAGYFSSMDEVARAQVPYFITRDDITAFVSPPPAGGYSKADPKKFHSYKPSNNYDKSMIKGGTVLKFLGVYEDISAFLIAQSGKASVRRRMPVMVEQGARYAKLVSYANGSAGEVIFVPITETGRFYVIANKRAISKGQPISYNHVYTLATLLKMVKLPCTVQLIVGPKPRNHQQASGLAHLTDLSKSTFSAVLRLEEIRVRDVILASTIRPQPFSEEAERPSKSISSSIRRTLRGHRFAGGGSSKHQSESAVLLEFDLDSSFTFVRTFVERQGTITSRKIPELVVQRLNYCNQEADLWRRQIKIAHDVLPRHGSDSGCSSGGESSPTHTVQKPKRPSLFDHEEFKKSMIMSKNASIGSRTSSTASNGSRISKILHRFWNPLKKRRDGEFSEIEEDATESDAEDTDEGLDSLQKKPMSPSGDQEDEEYHFYETLKPSDEAKFYPPKQKLSRKATLDVIFPSIVDDNGYILSNSKSKICLNDDEEVYSKIA